MSENLPAAAHSQDDWQAWIVEPRPPVSDEALALAAEIERETLGVGQPETPAPSVPLRGGASRRLAALTDAIAANPDSAANYVMRGELFLRHGERELAYADFVKALNLAAAQLEADDWGLVEQVVQDRAEVGLRRIARL
ncbi:MAG: hypothetical protein CUN53_07640 [Phototrophicales bacterium]|nr:MAG: hypothetical protein CUN53_07640 [Phototrophicales bacterium]